MDGASGWIKSDSRSKWEPFLRWATVPDGLGSVGPLSTRTREAFGILPFTESWRPFYFSGIARPPFGCRLPVQKEQNLQANDRRRELATLPWHLSSQGSESLHFPTLQGRMGRLNKRTIDPASCLEWAKGPIGF